MKKCDKSDKVKLLCVRPTFRQCSVVSPGLQRQPRPPPGKHQKSKRNVFKRKKNSFTKAYIWMAIVTLVRTRIAILRVGKKKLFFLLSVKKLSPPPLPLFWLPQFFLIRIFWIGQDPESKKNSFFMLPISLATFV